MGRRAVCDLPTPPLCEKKAPRFLLDIWNGAEDLLCKPMA